MHTHHPTERNERILVDFDLTLFRTDEFAGDLWQEMALQSGRTYAETCADAQRFHVDPVLGGYDFDAHIDAYGLDHELLWKKVDETVRSRDYLYPDSRPFMHALQQSGFAPSILSFGETRFQAAKIIPALGRLAGTAADRQYSEALLPFEVIFRRKGPYIAEQYPGGQGVLIDDVADQDLPDGFIEIHLDRKAGLESPQEKLGGFVVSDLHQAYQTIRTLFG